MKKLTRIIALLACVALLCTAFAACGGDGDEVVFAPFQPGFKEYIAQRQTGSPKATSTVVSSQTMAPRLNPTS